MKKLFVIILAAAMCLAFAACGDSSGYKQGEQFQLGDNTYALEKVVRATDNDTSATEGFGVSLLQVGNTSPVIISGLGDGTMNATSALDMTLQEGDTTYSPRSVSFAATDEVEGYGSRVIFYFDMPVGMGLPATGILKMNGVDETVQIDLTGLEAVEETTTTTTTTQAPTTIAVDPNYDPEANKDIGDTDIYQPIEGFDVTLPDTDF